MVLEIEQRAKYNNFTFILLQFLNGIVHLSVLELCIGMFGDNKMII